MQVSLNFYRLLLVVLCIPLRASADSPLVFDAPGNQANGLYVQQALNEAYAALSIPISYTQVPLARSYLEANDGDLDGLRGRIDGIQQEFPNLIKVPVVLVDFDVVLIINRHACLDCNMEDLDTVGYVRGYKAFEYYQRRHALPFAPVPILNIDDMLKLLWDNKLDGVVMSNTLVPPQFYANSERWHMTRLDSQQIFHYLHNQHQHWVEPLRAQLQSMQDSGRLAKLREQFHLSDTQ